MMKREDMKGWCVDHSPHPAMHIKGILNKKYIGVFKVNSYGRSQTVMELMVVELVSMVNMMVRT